MLETCSLALKDFDNLFVIAVGLTATYIAWGLSTKTANPNVSLVERTTFLTIVEEAIRYIKDLALNKKNKIKEKAVNLCAQIEYFEQESGAEKKGVAAWLHKKVQKIVRRIEDETKKLDQKVTFCSQYLRVISFDCFLFGLFALFIGTLQEKCNDFEKCDYSIDNLLQIVIFTVWLLLVHCLLFEYIPKKKNHEGKTPKERKVRPTIGLHFFILVIAVALGCRFNDSKIPCLDGNWLVIIAVITCFCGFISYFLINIIVNYSRVVILYLKLVFIPKEIKAREKEYKDYLSSLENKDLDLSQDNIGENLTIQGKAKTTNL